MGKSSIFCSVISSVWSLYWRLIRLRISHVQQYNTIQYNTIQYNTIQYNTIQYNTIQYNTIRYDTMRYDTIRYNTIQYNTIQYNTIQYNTIQYNTIQYNTIQYNTIQYNTIQYTVYDASQPLRGAVSLEVTIPAWRLLPPITTISAGQQYRCVPHHHTQIHKRPITCHVLSKELTALLLCKAKGQ